jgi:hypothetical protein
MILQQSGKKSLKISEKENGLKIQTVLHADISENVAAARSTSGKKEKNHRDSVMLIIPNSKLIKEQYK